MLILSTTVNTPIARCFTQVKCALQLAVVRAFAIVQVTVVIFRPGYALL